jgi:hypothetical protein
MAAKDALTAAAPDRVLIAVPVLAAPSKPVAPTVAAIGPANAKAAPPLATVAIPMAMDLIGFSTTASTMSLTKSKKLMNFSS